jgi:hypothetical protein
VQADSIKTRVESAFGVCNQRLKLKYDKLLSSCAFKFNLRHYSVDVQIYCTGTGTSELKLGGQTALYVASSSSGGTAMALTSDTELAAVKRPYYLADMTSATAGRCRLTVSKPELKARLVSEYSLDTAM